MKVLIGVDGSLGSDAAIRMVAQLLPDKRNTIQLYFSATELEPSLSLETPPLMREAVKHSIANQLFDHARDLLPERHRKDVETIVDNETPATGLLALADQYKPDLMAVGATGLGPIGRLMVGSVSKAVALGAKVPLLIGRHRDRSESAPLTVLLACGHPDGRDRRQAFLSRLAWPADTIARALHVEDSNLYPVVPEWLAEEALVSAKEPMATQWARSQQACIEREEQITENYCRQLPPPFCSATTLVTTGVVKHEIVRHAEVERADLLLVGGSHRSGIWSRFSLGRTADYVLAHANCSILLFPPQRDL